MKTKNKIIITSILAGLIILTACLKNVWTGFVYFSVSFLAALCLFWCGMFIYSYIENYKWHFENGRFVCLSEERFGNNDNEIGFQYAETAAHIIWQAAQDYHHVGLYPFATRPTHNLWSSFNGLRIYVPS